MSTTQAVISDAFDLMFARDENRARPTAIVVFQPPVAHEGLQGRDLRKAADRVSFLKHASAENQRVFQEVLDGYLRAAPARRLNARYPIRSRMPGQGLLPLATIDVTRQTLRALAKQPHVLAVLPNQPVRLVSPVGVPEGDAGDHEIRRRCTWGLQRLDVPRLWEQAHTRGANVKVAVLDTGVYGDHPALAGKVDDFVIIDPAGRRVTLDGRGTFDYQRHGTHVCGIIAGGETPEGVAIGVAPEARLAVAQIHFGERAFLSTVMDGIAWALEVGADIINMSIGLSYYDPEIDHVFQILVDRGVAPVVAIGNESHGSSSCPGNAAHAFGVGAVEKIDGDVDVAPFSSGCSLDFPGTRRPRIVKPDLVAPGVGILSCVPPIGDQDPADPGEFRLMDGSSMAAPHVSGVLALLMSANRKIEVPDLFERLRQTARHPSGDEARPDNRWGHGLINPLAALESVCASG